MTTRFVIDPTAMTIVEDTLIRSDDGILTFAHTGSVGVDCAYKTRDQAEKKLAQINAEREADTEEERRTVEMKDAFRAAFRNFRTSRA